MNLDHIPAILKAQHSWVCWGYEERKGKKTKVPRDPVTGKNARSNDPLTWGSFDQASRYYQAHSNNGVAGIGFELGTKPTGLIGIDLDHCRDASTGGVEPWARDIVERVDSYSEVTPSGTGVRIFVIGMLPPGGRKKGNFEVYDSGRYMTVTGQHVEGAPTSILDRSGEVAGLHREIFGDKETKPPKQEPRESIPQGDDDEIISRARSAANGASFGKLYSGDWSAYPSQSESDSALCMMLAFWCGKDEIQIDRLFRGSGLYRDKWHSRRDDSTYGAKTIAHALELVTETYHTASQDALTDDFPEDVVQEPTPIPTVTQKTVETAEAKPDALKMLRTGAELQTLECTVTWVWDKQIPEQSITLFSGKGGIGKTWLMLGIAEAVSKGLYYLDLPIRNTTF